MTEEKRKCRLDKDDGRNVQAVLAELEVGPDAWDVVIFGDGSGTGWNAACGWAAVLVDRATGLRKEFHGAMNVGTSYLAELMPYVQALGWYVDGPGKATLLSRLGGTNPGPVRVVIVTDSQVVARQGERRAGKGKGDYYWAALDAVEAAGFELTWKWMGRARTGLNRLCDWVAGRCRLGMDAMDAVAPPDNVYTFNPETV